LVVSDKTLKEGAVEFKRRKEDAAELVKIEQVPAKV